ncbi:MAG: ChaN family lipoprotein [Bacteroidota bacterium]
MRSFPILLAALLFALPLFAQAPSDTMTTDPATYRIFTGEGTASDLDALIAAMAEVDVVFLGEQHNDPVAHALQLDLLRAATQATAADSARSVTLSLEMFEQDVQLVLDEYLAGLIRERDFLASARPWSNYDTDYRPLVEHAREQGWPVIAANAPARYVRLVSQQGVEGLAALPDGAQAFLPDSIASASDALASKFMATMMEMMGHGGGSGDSGSEDSAPEGSGSEDGVSEEVERVDEEERSGGFAESASEDGASEEDASEDAEESQEPEANPHGGPGAGMPSLDGMLAAQNLRDVGMADAIAQHLDSAPRALVLHVTGSFHSESGLGVPEHLARLRPDARVLIVTMRPADDLTVFDADTHTGLGDFVVLTDASLPRTYETGF